MTQTELGLKGGRAEVRVSVVINTCDRGAYLADTLEGLKQQTYDNFEVILVNGPSTDDTEEVALRYNVRYYRAPYNISISRNIGIKHAAGDIIAFIDDDAVPEPRWLEDLVAAYDDPAVAAAGGLVYNHDGSAYQFCYGAVDKWGYAKMNQEKPYDHNEPRAEFYNINIGTNASYRRQPLVEIGGFDEEIEYFLDESDVCVRIINSGYKVAQLGNAYVHHKMAPSSRRDSARVISSWDAVVKNTIYFGLTHSAGLAPLSKRLIRPGWTELRKFRSMLGQLLRGYYSPWQYVVRNASLVRAMYRGYRRGFSSDRKYLKDYHFEPQHFRPYKRAADLVDGHARDIVLVTQGYPPSNTDGISRYNHTLAKELADRGHRVYVVTKNTKRGTNIYYRDKHWVYYHDPSSVQRATTGFGRTDSALALAKSVYATAAGIARKSDVDVVVAPLWDVEGAALIRHKLAPTILTLMSPLKKVVETQWHWLDDPSLDVMYDLERYCIENSDAVMAISGAIKRTIGDEYQVDWDKIAQRRPVEIIPLGVDRTFIEAANVGVDAVAPDAASDKVSVLFVGRFEKRKGIDLLLEIIPGLLERHENVEFHLVGNDNISDEHGGNYYREFAERYRRMPWFPRVIKYGYVSDDELTRVYRNCDIFVAPSRYESFGIIFIEAMAFGKPLVGADVGGIPEILEDGTNGLLFGPGDAADLRDKLDVLISDGACRVRMGEASRSLLKEKFGAADMGTRVMRVVETLVESAEPAISSPAAQLTGADLGTSP